MPCDRLINLSMDEILIVGEGVPFDEVLRKYYAECRLSFAWFTIPVFTVEGKEREREGEILRIDTVFGSFPYLVPSSKLAADSPLLTWAVSPRIFYTARNSAARATGPS